MVTFLDDQESIEKAFAVGATDYLTKPIHWAVLLQRLKRLISSSQATRELEDLRKWQDILTGLLELLSEPVLVQEGLAEIFLKIQDYFQVDRVLIEANDNANSPLTIVNNSQDRKKYSPEIISILSLLEAQSSLIITTLKPSPAYFIIASNEQREWQPKEIDRFTQIALLLSYYSPQ
jgi:response regulator RpfG family c-di-GMP phosphodiesterase